MLTYSNTAVMNIEGAIRGARNPMNSWHLSDSYVDEGGKFVVGAADLDLGRRLARAGSDHRKFLRQIFVSVDVKAPIYWWKEFDTYKVGTVANSTSTMHKIHSKEFSTDDFSTDHLTEGGMKALEGLLAYLEDCRLKFNETKDKSAWYDIISLLPSGYEQTRTLTMNYENLINIYYARKDHKLSEWHIFCDWIKTLPYADEWILIKEQK